MHYSTNITHPHHALPLGTAAISPSFIARPNLLLSHSFTTRADAEVLESHRVHKGDGFVALSQHPPMWLGRACCARGGNEVEDMTHSSDSDIIALLPGCVVAGCGGDDGVSGSPKRAVWQGVSTNTG